MRHFEVAISISKSEHVDALILGLVHQGYDVYYNRNDGKLCFTATDDDVTEVHYEKMRGKPDDTDSRPA